MWGPSLNLQEQHELQLEQQHRTSKQAPKLSISFAAEAAAGLVAMESNRGSLQQEFLAVVVAAAAAHLRFSRLFFSRAAAAPKGEIGTLSIGVDGVGGEMVVVL